LWHLVIVQSMDLTFLLPEVGTVMLGYGSMNGPV
jgi:hypothetical protein